MIKKVKEFSVKELIEEINQLFGSFYDDVIVKGEVHEILKSRYGHLYLKLKEETYILPAIIFKNFLKYLPNIPKQGDFVVARGSLKTYPPQGVYQLCIRDIKIVGKGIVLEEFFKLKEKLEKEGLFKEEHKKPIPLFPMKIGIITSKEGAAIRDIIKIIRRRNPYATIILRPTLVQGENAAKDMIKALKEFEKYANVDVIIIGRGGGSLEDLWCFNDEQLVREIFKTSIPIISAVGHQRDFVLTDFVADFRAETPSAAAEKVTENFVNLFEKLSIYHKRLDYYMQTYLNFLKNRFYSIKKHPYFTHPEEFIYEKQRLLEEYERKLSKSLEYKLVLLKEKLKNLKRILEKKPLDLIIKQQGERISYINKVLDSKIEWKLKEKKNRIKQLSSLLESHCPYNILKKGYSLIYKDKKIVKSGKELKAKEKIDIRFYDSTCRARVI